MIYAQNMLRQCAVRNQMVDDGANRLKMTPGLDVCTGALIIQKCVSTRFWAENMKTRNLKIKMMDFQAWASKVVISLHGDGKLDFHEFQGRKGRKNHSCVNLSLVIDKIMKCLR